MGGKENTQLALSSSKFLCVRLIRVREAETVFALRLWHWDTPPHRLVLVRLRTDLFSAFVCGSSFSTHHHRRYCGIYQRRALPTEWCLSWREDWGDASFFFTRVSTWARRSWQSPVRWPRGNQWSRGELCGSLNWSRRLEAATFRATRPRYPEDVLSVHTAPGLAKQ